MRVEEIKKEEYKVKLEMKFVTNDSKGVWQELETITNYKTKRNMIQVQNPHESSNEINNFYTRFGYHDFSQEQCDEKKQSNNKCRSQENSPREKQPDNISNKVLKMCCDQLAEPFSAFPRETLYPLSMENILHHTGSKNIKT